MERQAKIVTGIDVLHTPCSGAGHVVRLNHAGLRAGGEYIQIQEFSMCGESRFCGMTNDVRRVLSPWFVQHDKTKRELGEVEAELASAMDRLRIANVRLNEAKASLTKVKKAKNRIDSRLWEIRQMSFWQRFLFLVTGRARV